jgi:prepilin-type N-terminal cleavage/methylation domain-containing protein
MKNRRAFTLLEIMIALVILGVIGSVVAVQVKKMVDVHRFESEVTALFISLQEAQVLSATYQTDLALDIGKVDGKLSYKISTDEPFSDAMVNQNPINLSHVSAIKFNEASPARLHFDIYSGGRVEPRGALAFYQNEKALWLDLQRGHLIKFCHQKPKLVKETVYIAPPKEAK